MPVKRNRQPDGRRLLFERFHFIQLAIPVVVEVVSYFIRVDPVEGFGKRILAFAGGEEPTTAEVDYFTFEKACSEIQVVAVSR